MKSGSERYIQSHASPQDESSEKGSPIKIEESSTQYESADKDRWELDPSTLKRRHLLGHGSFGYVYFGEVGDLPDQQGTSPVAIKMLKDNANEHDKEEFIREAEVMKVLPKHPNVLSLLGCCTLTEPMMIVVEYMVNGNLKDYLHRNRLYHRSHYVNEDVAASRFTSKDLLSYAWQTAKGMEHISNHDLLHRDLAARNVLVGMNNTCKISDFGFARDVLERNIYHKKSAGPLPIRWMAPESLFYNIYTTKSDVWSFGILLWEIVTLGANPYPGMAAKHVILSIRKMILMEKPEHCKEEIYEVMKKCWKEEPEERPTFGQLVKELGRILEDESDYLDLTVYEEVLYDDTIQLRSSQEKI